MLYNNYYTDRYTREHIEVTEARKRGGQPNNTNALKHGFYTQAFTQAEASDLEAVTSMDLSGEIAMMRVSLRRVFEVVATATDPDAAVAALSALGMASTRLAGLLRVQKLIAGAGNVDVAGALSEALSEVIKEFSSVK
jgi:hypothetical protein